MPELTDFDRHQVFDTMTNIVGQSLTPGVDPGESWAIADWTSRRTEICDHAEAYLARAGDEVIGFLAYTTEQLMERTVVTLIAGCIQPEWQSKGVAFAFNFRLLVRTWRLHGLRPLVLVARVLNPKALNGWRRQLRDHRHFWPRIGSAPTPMPELEQIVDAYVDQHEHLTAFDKVPSVLRARHRRGERPPSLSGDNDVDTHYATHVDLAAGDTVLMAIYIDRGLVFSHLSRLVGALPRALWIRKGANTP